MFLHDKLVGEEMSIMVGRNGSRSKYAVQKFPIITAVKKG